MASIGDRRISEIEKLNNKNYYLWQFKVELLLIKEDLWEVITDEAPSPLTAKWTLKDGKCRATIGLLLEDSQLGLIRKLKTAKETWNALRDYHNKGTLSRKVGLLKSLCSLRLSDNGLMQDHLMKMESLVDQLSALGEKISDPLFVAFMLSSLPGDYATLITALETRPEGDLTVELVKNKLLEEFTRKNENKGSHKETENTALKSVNQASNSMYGDKNKVKLPSCFFCKKYGHVKSACRKYAKWKQKNDKKQLVNITKTPDDSDNVKSEVSDQYCFSSATFTLNSWCIDSGCSTHMSSNTNLFKFIDSDLPSERVVLANGKAVFSQGKGDCLIKFLNQNYEEVLITVKDVLFVPDLSNNLLSVKKLAENGYEVIFKDINCYIVKDSKTIASGSIMDNLYVLKESQHALRTKQTHAKCIHDWHVKLGHRNPTDILRMIKDNMTEDMQISPCSLKIVCEDCIATKACREPFPQKSLSKTSGILDLIHTDICGPMQTITPSGAKYILTVIDDYSRYSKVYLLKRKEEMQECIRYFIKENHTQFGKLPKRLRSDRGGEYISKEFEKLLMANGIIHEKTVPFCHQQNGVAERKNRTLVEMTRVMLKAADLPNKYWGEGVVTANYLQNRLPTKELNSTPYEKWYNRKPSLSHIQAFGSPVYSYVPKEKRRKLDDVAVKLIMVGYEEGTKGYRLLNTNTDKIVISRDVTFLPKDPHPKVVQNIIEITTENSQDDVELETEIPVSPVKEEQIKEEVPVETEIRRSSRVNKGVPPDRLNVSSFKAQSMKNADPSSYKEACSSPNKELWNQAMQEEIDALKQNKTWVLTDVPENKVIIGCKWVFKTKTDSEGNVSRYKARLVAQGYQQKYGHDYDEVFAPVAKPTTLRTLLTIAGKLKMAVRHYDIQSAYLNGDLCHEVYMKQPPGFEEGNNKVCKLVKNLYGLKQGANEWNRKLNKVLLENGFKRSQNDACLYTKQNKLGHIFITVHVDDIVIAGTTNSLLDTFEKEMSDVFILKNLGNLHYYLGINFERDDDGIFYMNQFTYISKKLKQYHLEDCKTSNIPIDPGFFKRNDVSKPLKAIDEYKSAIGSLLYLAVNTRPDIATAVSILARSVSKPTEADWIEVKRVFKYLKLTQNLSLCLGKTTEHNNGSLSCFVDADWGNDPVDRKSNTGYFFKYLGSVLTWISRKQATVTLSSTEAEFIALAEAAKEAIWLQRLLRDFGEGEVPCTFYEDNQSCIKMMKNEKCSGRTKHIDTRYHFVKDLIKEKNFELKYLPTDQMSADLLTKPLGTNKLNVFTKDLGLC